MRRAIGSLALVLVSLLLVVCYHLPEYTGRRQELAPGLNECTHADGQLYYVYVPENAPEDPENARILVAVHGYSGRLDTDDGRDRVRRSAERWIDLAEQEGWVVLAPQFDEDRFENDYQRLNLQGVRADLRLLDLVDHVSSRTTGIKEDRKVLLFGFSGGGQFVHRFCAFNAGRVDRAVAGAAGWYMWPDADLPYPLGVDPDSLPDGVRPDLNGLCGTDLLIIVGENDTTQSSFRKTYGAYDLQQLQGPGRRQRAQNWYDALQQMAGANTWDFAVSIQVIPDTEHTISPALKEASRVFLAAE